MPSPTKTLSQPTVLEEGCLLTFIESFADQEGWSFDRTDDLSLFVMMTGQGQWGEFGLEILHQDPFLQFILNTGIVFPPEFTQQDADQFASFVNRTNEGVTLGFFYLHTAEQRPELFLRYSSLIPPDAEDAAMELLQEQTRAAIQLLFANASHFTPLFYSFAWAKKEDRQLFFLESQGEA